MQSNAARFAFLALLGAGAVILFIVLSAGDGDEAGTTTEAATGEATVSDAPAEPAAEVIVMQNGAPVGGVRRLTYTNGEQVRINVRLDQPQEDVHIHGYEREVLSPSAVAKFDFKANIDGVFELEAHGPSGDVVLAEIVVNPA